MQRAGDHRYIELRAAAEMTAAAAAADEEDEERMQKNASKLATTSMASVSYSIEQAITSR